jgi:chromosome segregation ATPase
MTYSQRLSGGASLSEVLYLEQQIDQIKEEQVAAVEKLKRYEQEWTQTQINFETRETEADAENEQTKVLQKKIADVQMHVYMLSTRLEELENTLDELVD